MYGLQTCSPVSRLLFHLLIVSFVVQLFFSLIKSHLIFALTVCAFGIISKKSFPRPMPRSYPPIYCLLGILQSHGITFASLICFKLIFVSDIR